MVTMPLKQDTMFYQSWNPRLFMLSFYIHQQQLKANHEERYNEGQSKNTETFVITFLLYIILPNDLAIIFKQFE